MTDQYPTEFEQGEPSQVVDLQRAYDTAGHSTKAELRLLAKYAAISPAAIVELGTYLGRTAIALALAAKIKPVVTVDQFTDAHLFSPGGPRGGFEYRAENREGFWTNVVDRAGLRDGRDGDIRLYEMTTVEAAREWPNNNNGNGSDIGLLFVDADHNEEPLRADLAAWTPYIVVGGYLALHDHNDLEHGVMANSAELLATGEWARIDGVHSLAVFQRTAKAEPVAPKPVKVAEAKPVAKKPAVKKPAKKPVKKATARAK